MLIELFILFMVHCNSVMAHLGSSSCEYDTLAHAAVLACFGGQSQRTKHCGIRIACYGCELFLKFAYLLTLLYISKPNMNIQCYLIVWQNI